MQIQDTIVKVKDKKTRAREELNQFVIEAEKEHGTLANKFVMLIRTSSEMKWLLESRLYYRETNFPQL